MNDEQIDGRMGNCRTKKMLADEHTCGGRGAMCENDKSHTSILATDEYVGWVAFCCRKYKYDLNRFLGVDCY